MRARQRQQTVVATGASLSDLSATVADFEIPKGGRLRVEMDLIPGVAGAFDLAGAELAFVPFVPAGMILIDVFEEAGKGVAVLESDPAFLVPVITFMVANWPLIVIAGVTLFLAVIGVIVFSDTAAEGVADFPRILAFGLVGLGALMLLSNMPRRREAVAQASFSPFDGSTSSPQAGLRACPEFTEGVSGVLPHEQEKADAALAALVIAGVGVLLLATAGDGAPPGDGGNGGIPPGESFVQNLQVTYRAEPPRG